MLFRARTTWSKAQRYHQIIYPTVKHLKDASQQGRIFFCNTALTTPSHS